MDSNHQTYDFAASRGRLDTILGQGDLAYEEVDQLPDRDRLTFTNGFYANCSALFVDIRGSSDLPKRYKRPSLARLYRAYISELVAVMNGDRRCREINIVGDGVWCVVNTPLKEDINRVFETAYTANSMIKTLNYKIQKLGYDRIKVGMGMSWGRALMIKAGYAGSAINDVVYMGDVVNEAAKLAAHGNQTETDRPLMVSNAFYVNLNEHNQALLEWSAIRGCWQGNVVNTGMEEWYLENCT
jgi:class 3 adenylate cyclase